MPTTTLGNPNLPHLAKEIKTWGVELGFQQVGITDIDLKEHEQRLNHWLSQGLHGDLDYMAQHGSKRSHPEQLLPGTQRVISVRLDYLTIAPRTTEHHQQNENAAISRYAMGRDYHKMMRKRLAKLATRIDEKAALHGCRAFVDSAPVLERALAEKSGLGWIGKNTMLLNRRAGSYFFLGEIFTNLALPIDQPDTRNHCGHCTACLDACPTRAFVKPYVLDARKCISYLTIELKGPIPDHFRPLIGNRIFGCDDCQTVCPWNRFAQFSAEDDFKPRHGLDSAQLIALFYWTEQEFLDKTAGSAIRRTGYQGWLRNIAVALGNAPASSDILKALESRLADTTEMVQEHITWAISRQQEALGTDIED